jgi:hypothetical protein
MDLDTNIGMNLTIFPFVSPSPPLPQGGFILCRGRAPVPALGSQTRIRSLVAGVGTGSRGRTTPTKPLFS